MNDKKARTYLESLNKSLHTVMATDERVIVIGEDICDPYGGAFKVTKGLSSKFPGRVINSPISEGAIAGISIGLAIRGMRPVAEIMFGDFLALCADQILNSGSKFPLMYGDVSAPFVIRTPMGGGRGYGPTHSQCIEKMFLGVPGLKVVTPSIFYPPGELLLESIHTSDPVLFVEHKILYPETLKVSNKSYEVEVLGTLENFPINVIKNFSGNMPPDVVVIGYGIVGKHLDALLPELRDDEFRVVGIVPSLITAPLPDRVMEYIKAAVGVIVAEESTANFNWGSEVAANIYQRTFGNLRKPIQRLSSRPDVIPAAREAESEILLSKEKLKNIIYQVME